MSNENIPNCKNHPEQVAEWKCPGCKKVLCSDCIQVKSSGLPNCLDCKAGCLPIDADSGGDMEETDSVGAAVSDALEGFGEAATFFKQVPEAFAYTREKKTLIIIGIVVAFFTLLPYLYKVLAYLPIPLFIMTIFVWVLSITVSGYLFTYFQEIISSTTRGDNEAPDWPSAEGLFDSYITMLAIFFTLFGPGMLCGYLLGSKAGILSSALYLVGVFLLPMVLLAEATLGVRDALNFKFIIESILKVLKEYLFVCAILLGAVMLSGFGRYLIQKIGFQILMAIPLFISFFFLVLEARVIGLFYVAYQNKLGWRS